MTRSIRDKIVTVAEMAEIAARLRESGKQIVQSHGCFDLLHLGHVKHLEAARAHGDALVVTVTADAYVNKGPNRPIFPEALRAEMLAALEIVDYVVINPHTDAVPAIQAIRPSVYAKGQDYANPEGDVTGKITEERLAVESTGGRIIFTEEMTFSSTELINRNLNVYEPHLRRYLDDLRLRGGLAEMERLIDSVKDLSVLIVGDAIIDEYQYVLPMGKPPKENMIATRYQDFERFAGGVFAAANHTASFCKRVDIVTVLGDRDDYGDLIRRSLKANVGLFPVIRPGTPTTRKQRFVDPSYMRKLFEVYHMDDESLARDVEGELVRTLMERIADYDLVIAADFGHGMITGRIVEILANQARFLAINTQSNSANMGYNLIHKYPRADYVCIDMPEARLAVGDRVMPGGDIVSLRLPMKIDCEKFIVTHGKHGCIAYEKGSVAYTLPALTQSVVDTMGAGDAFLAITSPLVAAGAPLSLAGFIGNIAGALKVGIVGHQKSVEKSAVLKSLSALLK